MVVKCSTLLWNPTAEPTDRIDPSVSNVREQAALTDYLKSENLKVVRVLNTHLHLDHVLGNAFAERTFGIKAEAHKDDEFLLGLQKEQAQMFGLPSNDIALLGYPWYSRILGSSAPEKARPCSARLSLQLGYSLPCIADSSADYRHRDWRQPKLDSHWLIYDSAVRIR